MTVSTQKLRAIPAFAQLSSDRAEAISWYFSSRVLKPDEILWNEGDPANEMAMTASGEAVVLVKNQEVGRVKRGEILGETSVFMQGATRSATIRAQEPTELLLLSNTALTAIRHQEGALFELFLDLALASICRRIQYTDRRIAGLSQGNLAEQPAVSQGLAGLVKSVRTATQRGSAPQIEPLLRNLVNLRSAPDEVFPLLMAGFKGESLQKGEVLFTEGQMGNECYLVASGEVQVIRPVKGRRADVLATLGAGECFGMVGLVSPGTRTATCRASKAGWVYRMDSDAYKNLKTPAREVWKECIVGMLSVQLRNANQLLSGYMAGTHDGGPLPADEYDRLLRAAGALAGPTRDKVK